jgi:hypothetical protein
MDASTTRTPVKSIVLPEKLKELEDLEIQKPVS